MKKLFKRGFKPAKCKTALQLANSRLKILNNKTEVQIKQLRRELAQLLESGKTLTAQIRVEHLVRKEKRVTAYILIGIYCELLVLRLSVIESQKNCPIDLKEAVTSLLFASQRLSDVPELSEIFKQFKTKYGKDFVTSAIELRPDSGVSRLLVEKLSANAPDGPTKVKILLEIATEHNVVWEAKSFVEPDSKDTETLSGASSFQSASSINVDSSKVPKLQAPGAVNAHHGSCERHHSLENSQTFKQNWKTEFVDSTDAARAAAEAAERASFAARVAAELASKERKTRQDSVQSHLSSASVKFRKKPSLRPDSSNLQNESLPDDSFSPRRNVQMQHEDMDRTRQDIYVQTSDRHYVENLRKYGSFGKSGNEKQSSENQTSFNEPDPYAKFDDYGSNSETDDDQPRHRGKVSGRVDLEKRPSFTPSHLSSSDEDDSDEDLPTRASTRSQERTHKPTTGMSDHKRTNSRSSSTVSYGDDARVNSKPVVPQTVTSQDPETPSREKASHVHPKLPDYDEIFARLGALRTSNRR